MANPNKRKGDRAEAKARDWYRANGHHGTERTRAGYTRDAGDLHLGPGAIAQVKDVARPWWSEWLRQLADQKAEARADAAWLVVKRRGVGDPGQWLAVMTVEEHNRLLRAAGFGDAIEPEEAA